MWYFVLVFLQNQRCYRSDATAVTRISPDKQFIWNQEETNIFSISDVEMLLDQNKSI